MSANAVSIRGLSKSFAVFEGARSEQTRGGRFYALDDVSFDIPSAGCAVIAGANGSGKSMLMYIIAGLETPSCGELIVNETVGLVFQDADSQIIGETPREDVMLSARTQTTDKAKAAAITAGALAGVGLDAHADAPARFLSGGEKRRLAVAGVLALNAALIIFDEPYANLDYPGVVQVNKLIAELRAVQKTVIILTHELEKCLAFASQFMVLHKGRVVFCGGAEEGLRRDLAAWGVHPPLAAPASIKDLIWL